MLVTDFKSVGNKLFEHRKGQGLTQEQAAEKASVSARTYANIERGNVNMRVSTLLRICKALGITPDDLFTETPKSLNEHYLDVMSALQAKGDRVQEGACSLLSIYLNYLESQKSAE